MTAVTDDVRTQLLAAAYQCVADRGLGRTTVADVARAAGVARATVYRHFPGGREELLAATVAWEEVRFLVALRDAVAGSADLVTLLMRGLRFARAAVDGHEVLQKVLATEPDRLLPLFSVSDHQVRSLVAGFLLGHLTERPLGDAVDPLWAADELARLVMSYITSPGQWRYDDDAELEFLVRELLLGSLGVVGAPASGAARR